MILIKRFIQWLDRKIALVVLLVIFLYALGLSLMAYSSKYPVAIIVLGCAVVLSAVYIVAFVVAHGVVSAWERLVEWAEEDEQ